jgi:hypothetical protein
LKTQNSLNKKEHFDFEKIISIADTDLETQNSLYEEMHFDFGGFYLEHIRSFMKENNYIRLIAR